MPLALRKTRIKTIWDNSEDPLSWLENDDIAADPLTDLNTSNNELSIYVIKDDLTELDRCLSAMAAKRMRLQFLDYIIFDTKIIDQLQLETNDSLGNLPDQEVNKLHQNIINLSASKLIKLSKIIMETCVPKRILDEQVAKIIVMSINNKWVKPRSIDKKLLDDIEPKYYPIGTLQ